MTVTIEVVSFVAAPPARVFDLKLDVDVHAASQRDSAETAATRDDRRRLLLGDEVTFTARHFGLRWQMTSRITTYQRPAPTGAAGSRPARSGGPDQQPGPDRSADPRPARFGEQPGPDPSADAQAGRFVDEQVRGPFAMMRHEHLFEPDGAATRMTDRMTFAAPLGPLGAVVARLVLAPYLRRLLIRRAAHLDMLVRSGG
ncbi:SRPBCC family protein [Actinoplanes sp. NPDC026670]|uniref:SRPBCC family protein n=1 Tax=Actinoplanes sp. NPDC026670 TaxID=3154700 RepID=UPI0033D1BA59